MRGSIRAIVERYRGERRQLLAMLREVQRIYRCVPGDAIAVLAEELDLTRLQVEGTATSYRFLSREHRGGVTIYLHDGVLADMAGGRDVAAAFESHVGTPFGTTTEDRTIGLYTTSCIGLSDQEPAALINEIPFTRLDAARVRAIVDGIRAGTPLSDLLGPRGDGQNASPLIHSEVRNNIRMAGPVFFAPHVAGVALQAALRLSSCDVIDVVTRSRLRGRGGIGLPTGEKWAWCRAAEGESRCVIANAAEGEPGCFKDRVLLTERAAQIFEGMVIAGHAVRATRGFLYLRGEYAYLAGHLERVLHGMRERRLLGQRILNTGFDFEIGLRVGAGGHVCGEESALIESSEGKRAVPRNGPPYATTSGYRHLPTIVHNCETLGCVSRILEHGAEWFARLGTGVSAGVKLLSVAGDCARPGIYEVPWGVRIRDVLGMCGAGDTRAVIVGGAALTYVPPSQFDGRLGFEDLETNGVCTIVGAHRDLLAIVRQHLAFFARESCGFCVPCRAGTARLRDALDTWGAVSQPRDGIADLARLGQLIKATSRCGLGQAAPNPFLSTLANFPELYGVRPDAQAWRPTQV